jgi:hypothetical protein
MTWQLIDTAPKDGTAIDLWFPRGERETDCYWANNQWCRFDPEGYDLYITSRLNMPTHWMPVPEGPVS